MNAWMLSEFATGAHGSLSLNASAMLPIVMLFIGPSAPSWSGFLNGTSRASALMPLESQEMVVLSGGRSADWPWAMTLEDSPLR